MSVQITLDSSSLANFNKQMDFLKQKGETSLYKAICMVAMRIKTTAQLRLKGQRHVVTSRLINSIYMQAKDQSKADQYAAGKNPSSYSSNEGSFSAKMESVSLTDSEIAVGSNVRYADIIENGTPPHVIKNGWGKGIEINHPGYKGDSYLYWAMQNVNIAESLASEMRNDMKFGAGVKSQK